MEENPDREKGSNGPGIYWTLLDGKTSLGALSVMCPHLKEANAESLLQEIEGKSVRETEKIVAKYPQGKLEEVFGEALDSLIERLEKPRKVVATQTNLKRFRLEDPARPFDSRQAPINIAREVWQRDQENCPYISPQGKRCGATAFLQLDHIHPWVLGGSSHDANNLRVLCATHNRLRIP